MNDNENAIINSDNDIIYNPVSLSSPFQWYHHIPRSKYQLILECVGTCFQSNQIINNTYILPEQHIDCSICLDNIIDDAHHLICGHIFHSKCIQNWVIYHRTCPMCRASI